MAIHGSNTVLQFAQPVSVDFSYQQPMGSEVNDMIEPDAVLFDCDGVLVHSDSSWRILHDQFGTNNDEMLARFLQGELSDSDFMREDIRLWKTVSPSLSKEEVIGAFSEPNLIAGAKEVMAILANSGTRCAIISAGVDHYVEQVAERLEIPHWVANGFTYDENGVMEDEGVCRVEAHHKDLAVKKQLKEWGIESGVVWTVGDSLMDLSMMVDGTNFVGFNPHDPLSRQRFEEAGVPIIEGGDLRNLLPILYSEI